MVHPAYCEHRQASVTLLVFTEAAGSVTSPIVTSVSETSPAPPRQISLTSRPASFEPGTSIPVSSIVVPLDCFETAHYNSLLRSTISSKILSAPLFKLIINQPTKCEFRSNLAYISIFDSASAKSPTNFIHFSKYEISDWMKSGLRSFRYRT